MTLTAACLCLSFAAAPVPKERADAEKVVGTWKLVKSTNMPDGLSVELTMELGKDGKMVVRQSRGGGPGTAYAGEYKLEKGVITYTLVLPGGATKTEPLTVKKLTETQLHVVDPDGIQEDFERVKPAKKDDR
ncbi:MAG TPA: lipocalin family protein [Gemmata sp.]|jgi:uncharacterized protein (TIGR03066 family)|nr:lipocalin family protein [Gemmata sp.]